MTVTAAFAQTGTYTITGQVLQPNNSPFPSALLNISGTLTETVAADVSGTYSVSLPAGIYQVAMDWRSAPGPRVYNLGGVSSVSSGQGYIVRPFLRAPPEEEPMPAYRTPVHVPNTGQPTPADFWLTNPSANANDISDCWVVPGDKMTAKFAPPNTLESNKTHFTITFTAQPDAVVGGSRDIVCRYKGRDIVGWPYVVVDRVVHTITGRITTPEGKGLSGITVDPGKSVYTDKDGYYSLSVTLGTGYNVTPNDPGGDLWFYPRNTSFANITSDQTADFTGLTVTSIYVIHGINQSSSNVRRLTANLLDPSNGVDPLRFRIDGGFTFQCATSCGTGCSVNLGAHQLSACIKAQRPPGDIILVAYSMGGLISRDFIANDYDGVLATHPVKALITLGTPNLGYPYSSIDATFSCGPLLLDMMGGWQFTPGDPYPWNTWIQIESPYLHTLRQKWAAKAYSGYWMAAAGEQCSNTPRNLQALFEPEPYRGCLTERPLSDGVVCRDSALYSGQFNDGPQPQTPWRDGERRYVHTNSYGGFGTWGMLCPNNPSENPQMFDPPTTGTLFDQMRAVINAH